MTAPIPTLVIRPQAAIDAYQSSSDLASNNLASSDLGAGQDGDDFSAVMKRAVQGVIEDGQDAEQKSMQAIEGHGSLTDVVTSVSKAELALQTSVAIRDRMVQAYQTIMNMSI